jgi:hypothetical protein
MFIELGQYSPDDPAQWLVKIETVRANDFGTGIHYGWIEDTEGDTVALLRCVDTAGTAGDYMLYLNRAYIVAWRYADLSEVRAS